MKRSTPLSFEDVVRKVGIAGPDEFIPSGWGETQASYPADGPGFLRDSFQKDAARYVKFPDEITAVFLDSAAVFRRREEVCRLAWHCHRLLFAPPDRGLYPKWVIPSLGPQAGMYPALILLSGLPRLRELHAKRGIPDDITRDTLSIFEVWMRGHRRETGAWGIGNLDDWPLKVVFAGRICQLGRLSFMPATYYDGPVFRHRRTGEVRLLAREGAVFRSDGAIDGTNDVHDEKGRWTAVLVRNGTKVRGNPISESGFAVRREEELSEADWELMLGPGDAILDLHVPGGEKLAEKACHESFDRAAEFFPRYFPEVPFKAVACWTWLLDPTLSKILPPTSNLVKFQKMFHLYPTWGHETRAFHNVFGNWQQDINTAPRDTSLQRAVVDLYASGGRLLGGGAGILRRSVQARQ